MVLLESHFSAVFLIFVCVLVDNVYATGSTAVVDQTHRSFFEHPRAMKPYRTKSKKDYQREESDASEADNLSEASDASEADNLSEASDASEAESCLKQINALYVACVKCQNSDNVRDFIDYTFVNIKYNKGDNAYRKAFLEYLSRAITSKIVEHKILGPVKLKVTKTQNQQTFCDGLLDGRIMQDSQGFRVDLRAQCLEAMKLIPTGLKETRNTIVAVFLHISVTYVKTKLKEKKLYNHLLDYIDHLVLNYDIIEGQLNFGGTPDSYCTNIDLFSATYAVDNTQPGQDPGNVASSSVPYK